MGIEPKQFHSAGFWPHKPMLARSSWQRCRHMHPFLNIRAFEHQKLLFKQWMSPRLPLMLLISLLFFSQLVTGGGGTTHSRPSLSLRSSQSSQFTHALNELYASLHPLVACPFPLLLRPVFMGNSACVLPAPSSPIHEHYCELAGRILVVGDHLPPSFIHSST
jgi:hypothetical protein